MTRIDVEIPFDSIEFALQGNGQLTILFSFKGTVMYEMIAPQPVDMKFGGSYTVSGVLGKVPGYIQ